MKCIPRKGQWKRKKETIEMFIMTISSSDAVKGPGCFQNEECLGRTC